MRGELFQKQVSERTLVPVKLQWFQTTFGSSLLVTIEDVGDYDRR